ncbi:MAG: restriction endonuclease, partial [Acidimicrobiaceae bacterium]
TANPETAVEELVKFLPVLAYDGSNMTQVDAGGILDIALAGTSATLLARKWESAILVNVDNETLRKIMGNNAAMDAIMNIEGFRALGSSIFETVVNKSEAVRDTKRERGEKLTDKQRKELTAEEKEYKSKRKQIQEKLIKFATRIPAFMYLTDFRENTLRDVITKLEPDLFKKVTGLTVKDFETLVSLGVFNATHMNQAVFAFRRYEDASLSYTGIDSHPKLRHYGLYDTVIAVDKPNEDSEVHFKKILNVYET